jgi:hypothetical protein
MASPSDPADQARFMFVTTRDDRHAQNTRGDLFKARRVETEQSPSYPRHALAFRSSGMGLTADPYEDIR